MRMPPLTDLLSKPSLFALASSSLKDQTNENWPLLTSSTEMPKRFLFREHLPVMANAFSDKGFDIRKIGICVIILASHGRRTCPTFYKYNEIFLGNSSLINIL